MRSISKYSFVLRLLAWTAPVLEPFTAVRRRSGVRSLPALVAFVCLALATPAFAAVGTVRGKVAGPDGQLMSGVALELRNNITGFVAHGTTGSDGTFQFFNVPFNPYELHVEVQGFQTIHRSIDLRTTIPVDVPVRLELAALRESVTVTGETTTAQLETDTSASHIDLDKSYIARAAATTSGRAMEDLVTGTPGFAKDENGRFHFQGFHSQAQYVVDGQTISDQTGVTFSNSIDPGIAQSVEVIYGNVPAEYGEKIGAVINLSTKSGLSSPFQGDLSFGGARFGTYEGGVSAWGGSRTVGFFGSLNGSQSDRFLDPVNPDNLHNEGKTGRGFMRFDYATHLRDTVRLTALIGRTHRDVPNTYGQDAAGQDQRVHSGDQNFNLGWTHQSSSRSTFDITASARLAKYELFASPADTPVTATSDRTLNNYSIAPSYLLASGAHEFKIGGVLKSFPIREHLGVGITEPSVNDPENDGYNSDLAPYDLTRGGSLLDFNDSRRGTYAGVYVQDTIRHRGLTANLGLRYDHNTLPTTENAVQPRLGLAYYFSGSGTVLRASYNRLFVTPEYENILFSSSSLAASLVPPEVRASRELGGGVLLIPSERQHAYMVGAQQALGRKVRLDVDFWWRRSTGAGDQDQFENTGIVFPLAFDGGRHNGWDARLEMAQTAGFRGFISLGHTHAVYVPPLTGGLFLDAGALDTITGGPFLIDHDQKLQAQGALFYDFGKSGTWVGANLRYDSGLVTGGSPTELLDDPDNAFAAPFVVVHSGEDLDPNRIKARTVASFSLGVDLSKHGPPVNVQVDLLNAFATEGVYNILSVFGGTHVIPPRTLSARIRYSFGHHRN